MPAAGVAYDGSVWVTAVSSVALGELLWAFFHFHGLPLGLFLWIGWMP